MADSNPYFAVPEAQATCNTPIEKPLAGDVRFDFILIILEFNFGSVPRLNGLSLSVCYHFCTV